MVKVLLLLRLDLGGCLNNYLQRWVLHKKQQHQDKSMNLYGTPLSACHSGLFSFKNFHFMRLTASLGFEAKYLVASAIAVYPANRNTDIAVFRIAALTCGMTPHRTGEASSPNIVSRI